MHGMRRHGFSPFELQDGGKLDTHKVLHDVENGFFVSRAALNIAVALFARDQDQAEGFDFLPEGLVIHWLQIIHDVVYMSEFNHGFSIAKRIHLAQILPLAPVKSKELHHV